MMDGDWQAPAPAADPNAAPAVTPGDDGTTGAPVVPGEETPEIPADDAAAV